MFLFCWDHESERSLARELRTRIDRKTEEQYSLLRGDCRLYLMAYNIYIYIFLFCYAVPVPHTLGTPSPPLEF